MNSARRVLIVGGMALALLGMGYGLWYAVLAEHQELEGIGKSLATGLAAAGERDPVKTGGALEQYRELKYAYDRHVDVHGHWIGLALLLILVGMAYDFVALRESTRLFLAWSLLLGSLLFPLGVLLETFDHGTGPRAWTAAGSVLVILALAGMTVGFARPGNAEK